MLVSQGTTVYSDFLSLLLIFQRRFGAKHRWTAKGNKFCQVVRFCSCGDMMDFASYILLLNHGHFPKNKDSFHLTKLQSLVYSVCWLVHLALVCLFIAILAQSLAMTGINYSIVFWGELLMLRTFQLADIQI